MKLKLNENFCNENVYNVFENDPKYVEVLKAYKSALETNDPGKIDDAVIFMEAITSDMVYKKAFHDGMRFILDAMSGKEVVEL